MSACCCPRCEDNAAGPRLLGFGLDAIIAREAFEPTAQQRADRYHEAICTQDDGLFDLRAEIGQRFQDAWKRGVRPDLRAVASGTGYRRGGDLVQLRRYAESMA